MSLRVTDGSLHLRRCRTRLPFRFGAVTMERALLATLRIEVESDDGGLAWGYAADLLVPRWFDKDPAKSVYDNARDLLASVQEALAVARTQPAAATPFDQWWAVEGAVPHTESRPGLVRGFGIALVERACLDAWCRVEDLSFVALCRDARLGFRPEVVHPELAGYDLVKDLPGRPASEVALRHTVGMADPLRCEEAPLDDGLPATLEDEIREYGVDHFKLKIGAGPKPDAARLRAIAEVVREAGVAAPRYTLDGNEQYEDPAALLELLDDLDADEVGESILAGLLYVEQPFARAATLDAAGAADLAPLAARVPLVIDEADGSVDAFARARDLGYRGVSVKNCKGVFRALLNRGLCLRAGADHFQAAEDLTNLGTVPLQQSLATMASLGLDHAELNGHHYFRGLDHLGREGAAEALAAHPDLYRAFDEGASLRVEEGRLQFASVLESGFGDLGDPDLEEMMPLTESPSSAWVQEMLEGGRS